MKKKISIILSVLLLFVAWCFDKNVNENLLEGDTPEILFHNQLQETQYLKDLNEFYSLDLLSLNEWKVFVSNTEIKAEFDENSPTQWWFEFSKEKLMRWNEYEKSEISFWLSTRSSDMSTTPFDASWSLTLLYQDDKMYANVHDISLDMGWDDMSSKMYSLLFGMLVNKWIDLEVENNSIISINRSSDMPYILSYIPTMLETIDIDQEWAPNFTLSLAVILDIINSHVDLWFSSEWLSLKSVQWVDYVTLDDWSIQKSFTGSFESIESAFDFSFVVSKKWIQLHLYNINPRIEWREVIDGEVVYNVKTPIDWIEAVNNEIIFNLQEDKKSEYNFDVKMLQDSQEITSATWKLEFKNWLKINANFNLSSVMDTVWVIDNNQTIYWSLVWSINKKASNDNSKTEISGDVLLLSDLLLSLYGY